MKTSHLLFGLTLLAPMVHSVTAAAQDYEDLDSNNNTKAKKSVQDRIKGEQVREITRGFFLKASVGGAFYLGKFAKDVSAGTATALSIGQDFVDREHTSMAWELDFAQGIHNGTPAEYQVGVGPYIEGDLRTYAFNGLFEWNTYPARRWGLGLRAGAGVLYSPLLMNPDYYGTGVTPAGVHTTLQDWGMDGDPGYHGVIHPVVLGGPNLEYYTKLSHFSLGLDADVSYAIGWDLGMSVTGNMKYTF